jgi:hypothetical protein
VARTVFKTAEAVARRLVGSIPTRSRHVSMCPSPSPTHHLRVPLLYNRSALMLGVRDLEKL